MQVRRTSFITRSLWVSPVPQNVWPSQPYILCVIICNIYVLLLLFCFSSKLQIGQRTADCNTCAVQQYASQSAASLDYDWVCVRTISRHVQLYILQLKQILSALSNWGICEFERPTLKRTHGTWAKSHTKLMKPQNSKIEMSNMFIIRRMIIFDA